MRRTVAAAVVAAAVAAGFGGGFTAAKVGDGGFGALFHRAPAAATPAADKGERWSLFGKPRAANAPRPAKPKPSGFAPWTQRSDTSGAAPAACIRMTAALDPRRDYSDFVVLAPETGAPPAVRVTGEELCVGGLDFADRRVTLLKGLPARDGRTLKADVDVDFTFGDRPPFVGFAGDGVILPRDESDGLGIETVNVQRLAIEVWRVADRNLVRRTIAVTDATPEGETPDSWSSSTPDEEGSVVWKGQVAVQGEAGRRATTVFPLGAVLKTLKPGAYVVKARDASGARALTPDEERGDDPNPPAQASRWVVFTDMALTAYDGAEALDLVVRSLRSAKSMGAVRLALVARNGETLAEAVTDGGGRARFPRALLKGTGADEARMVMAYGPGADFAMLDLQRSPVDLAALSGRANKGDPLTGGRAAAGAVDAYLYADRGVYRPGETVRLTALVRDREARAIRDRRGALVIRRPSGVEFRRVRFERAEHGAVSVDLHLPASAPRGRWYAALEMEGQEGSAGEVGWAVEDFAPQRLAVSLGGDLSPLPAGATRSLQVDARFLYGAPGAGLATEGEARLRQDPEPFPAFKDYRFGDDSKPFDEKLLELSRTVTDGAGRAVLTVGTAEAAGATAPLLAQVTASVFEPGGRAVRETEALKVRALPLYLGVLADQGQAPSGGGDPLVTLKVVALNAAGQRVAARTAYTLVAERWDYDWFQQDGRWQWRRTSRDRVVQRGEISVGAGAPAQLARRLGWGDYRLELTGPDGARTVSRFTSGWGAPAADSEAPDAVRVSVGPRQYAQGDTVEVTLKPPYAGEAQVAVVTDRLIDFKTLTVDEKGATVRLKSSAAWGGGAYVLVTVIQPRDPAANPRPRRALGLAYAPLKPQGRTLSVAMDLPAVLDSKAAVEVPLKVEGLKFGQTARVTVAAVDEGILRLTRFDSPDPVQWWFGKRALTLNYRDDYGRLLDPNLGAPANVNFGGDEIGGEGLTVTPIKTVALWSGVVETGRDGRAVVRLPAADFNGQLRVMAVAWTDEAVGSGSRDMTVRQPVVADLNPPRFLAPGDEALMALELHNLAGRAGEYVAEVSGQGGLIAGFRRVVALALNQRWLDRILLRAPDRAGIGRVDMRVRGPGFEAVKSYPLQTRLGWGPVTRVTTALQQPGESFTPAPELIAGLAAGSVTLQVSYSPIRGFDPSAVAATLNRYPYGCTEQIISAATPLLFAGEATGKAAAPAQPPAQGLAPAVARLLDRQTQDGAFGLWAVGDGEADPWLGAYAVDFLLEAKARGVAVPDGALDRALNSMRILSKPDGWSSISYRMEYPETWAGDADSSRKATARMRSRAAAYALLVLAKGGRGDLARLRWFHDVQFKDKPSPLAKAQVGAGLALMGDRARAADSFRQAEQALTYKDPQDWYQSPLRDLAGVIALAYDAGQLDVARRLQGRLEGAMRDPDQLNTQEQAQLMKAAARMMRAAGPVRIEAAGVTPLPAAAGAPRFAVGALAQARLVNRGGAVWRTVTVIGTPTADPGELSAGLSINKRLFTTAGAPLDLAQVVQGQRVVVRLSGVSGQARTTQLVLDDALPAGFEIETVLTPEDGAPPETTDGDGADDGRERQAAGPFAFLGRLTAVDVQERRDDRYVAATDLEDGGAYAVAYVARAVTPGRFLLPGAVARDMYRPQVQARTPAQRTTIAAGG